jgi:hypothetical protein
VGGKTENIYELFEFFIDCYKATPKEKLLELMPVGGDHHAPVAGPSPPS